MQYHDKKFVATVLALGVFFAIATGVGFAKSDVRSGFAAMALPDFQNLRRLLFPAFPETSAPPAPSPGLQTTPVLESGSLPPILPLAESYEQQIENVVERTNASVVSIIISKNLPIMEQQSQNPFQDFGIELPPGLGMPQYQQKGYQKQEVGGGSGFVITSEGLIVTNRHVVEDLEAEYTVLLNDGDRISAKVIARDPVLDLAMLKINKSSLKALALGDSGAIKLGATAIAIGNALGEFRNTVSVGVISGLARTIQASDGGQGEVLQNVLQTDAAINRGNSGGPLLNLRGEVIGVNTATVIGAQNIGFAIPINQAKASIEQVRSTGKISVAFLGVRYQPVTPLLKESKKLSVDYGAFVEEGKNESEPAITKNSPADKIGLRSGDIILELNGEKINTDNPLSSLIRKYKPGDVVTCKVLRGDQTITLKATLAERK